MLRTDELRVSFGATPALAGVSLTFRRGELVGLIGPPASGKTVLLKALAGLIRPSAGEIFVDGHALSKAGDSALADYQRRVGMAFQNDALFDSQNVFDNVAFGLRRRGVDEAAVEVEVRRRLEDVGLWEARARLPSQISGGMRKRVGVARAVVVEPEVGLFDDPIAGLDPVTASQILEMIVAQHRRLSMATLVISNDLGVFLRVCDRVVMLHDGAVVYDGGAAGLAQSSVPVVRQFALGSEDGPL